MRSHGELRFVSLMAANATPFWRAVCECLSSRLGAVVRLVDDVPWQVAAQQLYSGQADLGIVCGLHYVNAVDGGALPGVQLLCAPVMRAPRYMGLPVYFSDVVVPACSMVRSLSDLPGARWAYNEPTSHSGYSVVRYALAVRQAPSPFFGETVQSGAHQRSLAMLLSGEIDATAVDSTVLEQALRSTPGLADAIRVVDTLGPSPIPPVVASRALSSSTVAALREALLSLPDHPALELYGVSHFTPVTGAAYDPIRHMAAIAAAREPWTASTAELMIDEMARL